MQRNRPTPKQVSTLRRLAAQTGTTFSWPQSKKQASTEIDRLIKLRAADPNKSIQPSMAKHERREISETPVTGSFAPIREDEITGYGSSAQWI